MIRTSWGRRLAVAGLAGAAVLGTLGAPARAAGPVGASDGRNDVIDPYLAQSNAQKGGPGYNVEAPIVDLTDFSLSSAGGTSPGSTPLLIARVSTVAHVPDWRNPDPTFQAQEFQRFLDASPYPTAVGTSYQVMFQDTKVQRNSLQQTCMRITGFPLYQYFGHHLDGFRLFVELSVDWDGTKFNATPSIGWYNPEDGFHFYALEQADAATAALVKATRVDDNTIEVQVPSRIKLDNALCEGGNETISIVDPYAANPAFAGPHTLTNLMAMTYLNSTVTLPVAIPLSKVPNPLDPSQPVENDIQSLGGLVAPVDSSRDRAGNEMQDIGLVMQSPDNLGPGEQTTFQGSKCPLVLQGQQLNPVYAPGQACQTDNPVGPEFLNSGISLAAF